MVFNRDRERERIYRGEVPILLSAACGPNLQSDVALWLEGARERERKRQRDVWPTLGLRGYLEREMFGLQ